MQAMKTLLTSLLVAAFVAAGACAAEGVGAERRLPVVAIPDYCQSNGVVSVKRSMTEAILKAGCLPVLLPEMEDPAVDQFLSQCDAVMVGGGIKGLHFGGTLAPVPSDRKLVHKDASRFERTGERAEHPVSVSPGDTLMAGVFGEGSVKLNSSHTMRCLNPAPGFRVTARAEDGVIEAIEHETLPIFGFQFHPEIYWKKDARCLELLRLALRGKRK